MTTNDMHIKIASIMLVASILGLGAIAPVATVSAQTEAEAISGSLSGGFASITTEQTGDTIVITITRDPGSSPTDGNVTLPEVPEGPIIIVPDPGGEGNGTIIVPSPGNETGADNVTVPTEPPVIVIPPDGNVTEVTPPSNVTVIDNDTVIVAPPDQNVTETPGNVTVIDPPPAGNVTEPTEPCACPPAVAPAEPAPPVANDTVIVTPPAENETIIVEPPVLPPVEGEGGNGDGNGNGNGGG